MFIPLRATTLTFYEISTGLHIFQEIKLGAREDECLYTNYLKNIQSISNTR